MTSPNIRLLGLSGSLRAASTSTAIVKTLQTRVADRATMDVFPLGAVPLYNSDLEGDGRPAAVGELRAAIEGADAIVLCSPEYNYGMSGVLKNALDWASRPAYNSPLKGKPALIISSSPGHLGGVRAHQQVRETLGACLARVIAVPQVAIPGIYQKIADGRLVDEESIGFAMAALEELLREIALVRGAR